MRSRVKLPATLKIVIVFVVVATSGSASAHADTAELIPVIAFNSTDSSSSLDPANWSPYTPQPSVVAVLNKTAMTQTDSDDCLESNGTRVLVHDVNKSFCVYGWPHCNADNHKGLCPRAQHDLPNGAQCSFLPGNKSVYGCLEKVVATACHLRSSKT